MIQFDYIIFFKWVETTNQQTIVVSVCLKTYAKVKLEMEIAGRRRQYDSMIRCFHLMKSVSCFFDIGAFSVYL